MSPRSRPPRRRSSPTGCCCRPTPKPMSPRRDNPTGFDRASVTLRPPSGRPHPAQRTRRHAMLIRKRRGWELPERAATDETVFRDRRRLLKGLAAGPILAGVPWVPARAAEGGLYPAKRNDTYKIDRPVTDEKYPT